MRVFRVLVMAACLVWLAGCETTQNGTAATGEGDVTGSIAEPGVPLPATPESTGLTGEDPNDDLNLGKKYYRENSFGLAEQHFRRAVESGPKSIEAWVGLAASYDKLRRFDLADRAYAQAIRLAGPTPEILNNQGYSYMLRGNLTAALTNFRKAQKLDPDNVVVANNIQILANAAKASRA